jgi:hypothetical protein
MHVCWLPQIKLTRHQELVPFILISRLLDQFNIAKIYIKIDLCGTYNLMHIQKSDEWKTTFRICYNDFEYVVMPFGLTNALVVF